MAKERAEWPKYMFHAETGKGKVFESADKVADGYITRDEYESKKPAPSPAAPASDNPNKGLAKANGLTKKGIVAELDEAGIEYDKSLAADDLAAFYLSLPDEEEDEDAEDDDEE